MEKPKISEAVPSPAREVPEHLLKSEMAQQVKVTIQEGQQAVRREQGQLQEINRALFAAKANHRQVVQDTTIGVGWWLVGGAVIGGLLRIFKR